MIAKIISGGLRPGSIGAVMLAAALATSVSWSAESGQELETIVPRVNLRDEAGRHFDSRLERLKRSLAGGDASGWDGVYSWGTGYEGATLHYVQSDGYAYQSSSCVTHYLSSGEVAVEGSRFALRPDSRSKPETIPEQPLLVPVRWGERRYLVPAEEIGDFAADIGVGEEPRCGRRGRFFLREGNEKIVVSGLPELPPEWQGMLHADDIDLQVTSFDVATTYQASAIGQSRRMKHTVRLDGGADRGVMVGMLLRPARGEPFHVLAHITQVQAHSAVAELVLTVWDSAADDAKPPLHGGTFPLRDEVAGPYVGATLTIRGLPENIGALHCEPVAAQHP
jgi:hypothetical protein